MKPAIMLLAVVLALASPVQVFADEPQYTITVLGPGRVAWDIIEHDQIVGIQPAFHWSERMGATFDQPISPGHRWLNDLDQVAGSDSSVGGGSRAVLWNNGSI